MANLVPAPLDPSGLLLALAVPLVVDAIAFACGMVVAVLLYPAASTIPPRLRSPSATPVETSTTSQFA